MEEFTMFCGILLLSLFVKTSTLFPFRIGNYTGFHTLGPGGEVWIPLLHPHGGDEARRGLRKQEPF